MRLAVLSDIHSNLVALDAVLDDLAAQPAVDATWVLGDIVGYGPQPNEVVARLQTMSARAVMGNHDGAAVGLVDTSWFNPAAAAAIGWTTSVLTPESRAFLADLPPRRVEEDLTGVHGSPRDPIWEYIVSPAVAAANLDAFDTRFCLFGHTHHPTILAMEDGTIREVAGIPGPVHTHHPGRGLVNPGSVGQPRDGDPRSAYLILDTTAWTAEFRRVSYDIEATQHLMREHDLQSWLAERLSYGR